MTSDTTELTPPPGAERGRGPTSLTMTRAMLLVFTPFACGYFFSYFYRSVNAVVAPDLRAELGVNAAELGLLSAAYFLTFAICQIPLGVLLDRYGPRRVQGSLYALAALGALLFAFGDSTTTLLLARGLIGIGVSGGLMAALKAIVLWFPRERIALINGFYFTSGAIGALAATVPTEIAVQAIGWRPLFMILAAATLAAAVFIWMVVPEKPGSAAGGTFRQQIRELGAIYRDQYFWRIVPLMFTGASAQMAIAGLWAGPWLSDVDGYPRDVVADHLLVMAAGMAVGTMLSGPFASALQRIGISIAGACGVAGALYLVALLLVVTRLTDATYVTWGIIGLVGTLTSLVFAALAQHFPETHVGRANTAANVIVFGMSFAYQFGLGAIVELWAPLADGTYPTQAYTVAFLAVAATQVLALLWFLRPGEASTPARRVD